MLLLIHVGIALWFLDGHISTTNGLKRVVALSYGGIWVALSIDAIGRHTSLGFSRDIPLHPALGAFNDFRLMVAGGIVLFWVGGAFVSTIWAQKPRVDPLENPFSANPSSGAWGGVRDGLEWLAHQAFMVLDIVWRGGANAFFLSQAVAI